MMSFFSCKNSGLPSSTRHNDNTESHMCVIVCCVIVCCVIVCCVIVCCVIVCCVIVCCVIVCCVSVCCVIVSCVIVCCVLHHSLIFCCLFCVFLSCTDAILVHNRLIHVKFQKCQSRRFRCKLEGLGKTGIYT